MKKRIISYITFGLLLIALGIIGTFLKWGQARVLLGMGFLFELLAVLFFVWDKIKNKS
jgi:hypothetical protein